MKKIEATTAKEQQLIDLLEMKRPSKNGTYVKPFPPLNPCIGDLWHDTTTSTLYIYYAVDNLGTGNWVHAYTK